MQALSLLLSLPIWHLSGSLIFSLASLPPHDSQSPSPGSTSFLRSPNVSPCCLLQHYTLPASQTPQQERWAPHHSYLCNLAPSCPQPCHQSPVLPLPPSTCLPTLLPPLNPSHHRLGSLSPLGQCSPLCAGLSSCPLPSPTPASTPQFLILRLEWFIFTNLVVWLPCLLPLSSSLPCHPRSSSLLLASLTSKPLLRGKTLA